MAIRPKVGDRVEIGPWHCLDGQTERPENSNGVVEKVLTGRGPRMYHVRREFDDRTVTLYGSDFRGYAKE